MKTTLLAAAFLATFSFAQQSNRLSLPKELQSGIIPNFFVLASLKGKMGSDTWK